MPSEFEQNLDKYAELAVKVGLNLQPGQRLLIGTPASDALTPLEAAPLVRLIAIHAYEVGARLVDVMWGDEQLQLIRLRHAPRDSFTESPIWGVNGALEYIERGDAILPIWAHDPDLLKDQDPALLATIRRAAFQNSQPISNQFARNATNWTIITVPVTGWSSKLFHNVPVERQDAKLWDALFDLCRVRHADPVAAWQKHLDQLIARSDYLNRKQYAALKLTAPGTDLSLGLPHGHIWQSACMTSQNGIRFTANLPTEEVFTIPHKDKTEGYVTSTKPLSYAGALIENFRLAFVGGRVVQATAEKGEEDLRRLIETDEGASRLGEVALVPHSSPVSQSGLLFYNSLLDENASDHLALGRAFKFSLEKGETMSADAFAAAGGNQSLVHVDFMVGSSEMDVDGLKEEGLIEPLMRNGEWVFEP